MKLIILACVLILIAFVVAEAKKQRTKKQLEALTIKRERLFVEGRACPEIIESLDKEIKRLNNC